MAERDAPSETADKDAIADPWSQLRRLTPARIALGRAGPALPTRAVLEFALAHARARDAVHAAIDTEALSADVAALGSTPIVLESQAVERRHYLSRPDHGRRLTPQSRMQILALGAQATDLAIVIGDGLSAAAVTAHAVALTAAILPVAKSAGLSVAPVLAIVKGARVAIGDEIGEALKARTVAILIGERPGLSSPDSLSAYLTYQPMPGRSDAERNCISNIRPAGLALDVAAHKLAWLTREALRRGLSGVALKDESGAMLHMHNRPDVLTPE